MKQQWQNYERNTHSLDVGDLRIDVHPFMHVEGWFLTLRDHGSPGYLPLDRIELGTNDLDEAKRLAIRRVHDFVAHQIKRYVELQGLLP